MTLNVYALSVEVIAVMIRFYKIAATLTVVLLFAIFVANVTWSDKIGLIYSRKIHMFILGYISFDLLVLLKFCLFYKIA